MANQDVISEARTNFKRVSEWESETRTRAKSDFRMNWGDQYNNWQWPSQVLTNRTGWNKPFITINKIREQCLNVVNDMRQNKPDVKILPVGNGATYKAAEIFEGVIRHIEYDSNAQASYDTASNGAVVMGIGWFRLITKYANDYNNDQKILIQRIEDPLSVFIDPNCLEFDKSDARFGIVFFDIPKETFDSQYPKFNYITSQSTGLDDSNDRTDWKTNKTVRVAEYYRKIDVVDELCHLQDGRFMKKSEAQANGVWEVIKNMVVSSREVITHKIEIYKIAGNEIIEATEWAGNCIPLICIIGEEGIIDNKLDRKGHVRNSIGPQQELNYYSSSGLEYVALATKTPYITPVKAIENRPEWANTNQENLEVLTWNHMGDNNQPIPPPTKIEPPVFPTAYLDGMKVAEIHLITASGQGEAVFGAQSNERSGKAINERQHASSNQTYHFIEHQARAILNLGRQLIYLIPKIYDTDRILKIMGQAGEMNTIHLDPDHQMAHQEQAGLDSESFNENQVAMIFNPNVGEYSVVADIGPNYATRRQETFNALTQILTQNETLTPVIGDLLFRCSDFDLADEIADRMKRMVPAQALGGPTIEEQKAQQQIQMLQAELAKLGQENLELKSKAITTETQKEIDLYKAQTDRLEAIGKIDPPALKPFIREAASQIAGIPINKLIHAHMLEENAVLQSMTPPPEEQEQTPPTEG